MSPGGLLCAQTLLAAPNAHANSARLDRRNIPWMVLILTSVISSKSVQTRYSHRQRANGCRREKRVGQTGVSETQNRIGVGRIVHEGGQIQSSMQYAETYVQNSIRRIRCKAYWPADGGVVAHGARIAPGRRIDPPVVDPNVRSGIVPDSADVHRVIHMRGRVPGRNVRQLVARSNQQRRGAAHGGSKLRVRIVHVRVTDIGAGLQTLGEDGFHLKVETL